MNIWEVLGINPTRNKKEIKRAYAQKVKQCHSEDNPVGDNNTAEGRQLNRRSDIVIKFHDNGGIE